MIEPIHPFQRRVIEYLRRKGFKREAERQAKLEAERQVPLSWLYYIHKERRIEIRDMISGMVAVLIFLGVFAYVGCKITGNERESSTTSTNARVTNKKGMYLWGHFIRATS